MWSSAFLNQPQRYNGCSQGYQNQTKTNNQQIRKKNYKNTKNNSSYLTSIGNRFGTHCKKRLSVKKTYIDEGQRDDSLGAIL